MAMGVFAVMPDLNHYDNFLLALETAPIAKAKESLSEEQILIYRTSLLETITEHSSYIKVKDFSLLSLDGQDLEGIQNQVQRLAFPLPIMGRFKDMTTYKAIPLIIEGIYKDIDAHSRKEGYERQMEVNWAHVFRGAKDVAGWYKYTLPRLGRPLLGYLMRSNTFSSATYDLSQEAFMQLVDILKQGTASFMIFCRVRLDKVEDLDPNTGEEIPDKFPGVTIKNNPHSYVVPRTGYSVSSNFLNTIEENIYDKTDFRGTSPPDNWPETFSWPSHPGVRHYGTKCKICNSRTNTCKCKPPVPTDGQFLVEIYDYGAMGCGIRSLGNIRKATIIGEYVGRLRHANAELDSTSAMQFFNPLPGQIDHPIAMLDASKEGNWTRFINHACENANIQLTRMNIGAHSRIMVQALRDIGVWQQLTMDYGEEYWDPCHGRTCLCGSTNCYSSPGFASAASISRRLSSTALESSSPVLVPTALTASALRQLDAETVGTKRKRSWFVDQACHSSSTSSSDSSSNKPRKPKAKSKGKGKGKAKAKAKAKTQVAATAEEFPESSRPRRQEEAQARVTAAGEVDEESDIWSTRWVGQDNLERPRRNGGKTGGPFYGHF